MADFETIRRMFNYLAKVGIVAPAPKSDKKEGIQEDVKDMINAWQLALDDVPNEELYVAAIAYAKEGTYWPKPADIRKHCPSVQRKKLADDAAHKEEGINYWPRILRACSSIGPADDWHTKLAKQLGIPDDAQRLKNAVLEAAGTWKALRLADHDATRHNMGVRFNAAWSRAQEVRRIDRTNLAVEARRQIAARKTIGVNDGK